MDLINIVSLGDLRPTKFSFDKSHAAPQSHQIARALPIIKALHTISQGGRGKVSQAHALTANLARTFECCASVHKYGARSMSMEQNEQSADAQIFENLFIHRPT